MRPASIFFNIQLSNSRIAEGKGAGKQYHYWTLGFLCRSQVFCFNSLFLPRFAVPPLSGRGQGSEIESMKKLYKI